MQKGERVVGNTEEPVISIEGLWMNYSDRMVLRGIDLEVYRGQIIGYIGPNGAGKSTTVKIMLGLVEGYSGSVRIFGRDISDGDTAYKEESAMCRRWQSCMTACQPGNILRLSESCMA